MATTDVDKMAGWFAGRLPDGWFAGAPSVTTDEKQVLVVGTLTPPELPDGASADYRAAAEAGRISRFREATRPHRIAIAREAERRFERPVTWGAACGGTTVTFTPGGSGRQAAETEGEPKKVMIAAHPRVLRAWRRRIGVPGAWRFGWEPWAEPRNRPGVQRF